jgi:hypothetical protein
MYSQYEYKVMDQANFGYSLFTAFGVILIGIGMACQILYIDIEEGYKAGNDGTSQMFQYGALVVNTTVVIYLLFVLMYYRPFDNPVTLALFTIFLIGGMALELYLISFDITDNNAKIGEYILTGFNVLLRLYLLIAVRCNSALTSIPQLMRAIPKLAEKTGTTTNQVVRAIGAEAAGVDPNQLFQQIMSNMGGFISEEKKGEAREAARRVAGLPPKQGGRRR